MSNTAVVIPYPPDYPEKCFQVWFAAGCPGASEKLAAAMPTYKGHKPNPGTLRKWMDDFGWKARAEEINQKAVILANENLLQSKVELLKNLAEQAKEIQDKARQFLLTKEFDTHASAVNAYFKATDLLLSTAGLNDALMRLAKMDNKELMREIARLAERARGEEIIETGEFEDQTENIENTEDKEYEEE